MSRRIAGAVARLATAAALVALAPAPAVAQQSPEARLRNQRQELDRIRRERADLEARMQSLRSSLHDLSDEVDILNAQADATARAVRSLDAQLTSIREEVGSTTADLVRAEDELVVKRAVLRRRLSDIYKRGPLYPLEALLSAQTFGELVARYKYLHLIAVRDRALVARVEDLARQISRQRGHLVRLEDDVEMSLQDKADEERRLRQLEEQQVASLRQARRSARRMEQRLAQITRAERQVTSVIADLEAARRRAEAARPNAPRAASTLTTRELGQLDWPVDGTVLYRFGRVVNPNNTTTRWNGMGIAASEGTPVRAVAAGQVVTATRIGTYGLTVIVQHGGGDYSVYGSLASVAVREGGVIGKGQTVGSVGSADPDLPAHLHFEIRPGGRAVDPLEWLKAAAAQ
ncbi:MAG TPA: peptidoglycan DD-metalloendopeptidase family protein [Gemmatimonadaceae bacterium]|nr:peptidoglycan DD-metalloendopeptidase family protein [Gemmatimonadaceae bacterium]